MMRFDAVSLLMLAAAVSAAAAEPIMVEARIKFISMTRPLMGVGVTQGKQTTSLVIPTDMFSDQLTYRGPSRLELVETSAAEITTNEKSVADEENAAPATGPVRGVKGRSRRFDYAPSGKAPLAWIDLPANLGPLRLILLVTPGKGNGITMLKDSPGSFPAGSVRYVNLSGLPVTAVTPSGDHFISPGAEKIFRPGAADNDYYDLRIKSKVGSDEVIAFSSRVFHMETVRKIYLLLPAQAPSGGLIVRDIEDRPEPVKARPPSGEPPKKAK